AASIFTSGRCLLPVAVGCVAVGCVAVGCVAEACCSKLSGRFAADWLRRPEKASGESRLVAAGIADPAGPTRFEAKRALKASAFSASAIGSRGGTDATGVAAPLV